MITRLYSILNKMFILVFFLFNTLISFGQWQHVGYPEISDGTAIYNNLKFHNNEPYVAFKDWSNNYGATVLKYNGTNWENIGNSGFSNEVGAFLDFVFHNNQPYVAFDDNDNSRVPAIMTFNGSSWVSLPSPSTNVAYDINLKSNNGNLYIAYKDFDAQFKVTVKKFNGSDWEIVGNQGFSAVGTFWLDLEFYNDVPYVAYKEGYDGVDGGYKATVMKFNGVSWEEVGSRGFSPGQITYSDLAFYNGQPCIAFSAESNNQRLAVMTFNGENWIDLSSQDFTNDYASTPDLKVYNNELYVLYVTGGLGNSFARLKKYNGTNWENVTGDLITNSVVFNTSLNFLDNEIYVAMENISNSRKLDVIQSPIISQNTDNIIATATATYGGCNGSCDGTILINASGGVSPLTYSLTYSLNYIGYQASNIFNNVCPGHYVISIRDSKGFSFDMPIDISPPLDSFIITKPSANENSGVIQIIAAGGAYSYLYSINGYDFYSQNIFSDLPPGDYEATVMDLNQCLVSKTITLDEIDLDNSLSVTTDELTLNINADTFQWINSDTQTIIEGENNKNFKPEQSGKYRVEMTLTDPSNLVSKSSKLNQTISLSSATYDFNKTLGVTNYEHETIKIYPNPAKGYLKLSSSTYKKYIIYSTLGKKLQSGEIINQTISIDKLAKSIYYLQIDGNSTIKFVKN